MRNGVLAVVVLAGVLPRLLQACIDPMSPWEVGVIFTDGEQCIPERIEQAIPDSSCYLKTCTYEEAYKGKTILRGEAGSGTQDQLTITGVSVSINTLCIAVRYGGGCKEHLFNLYHDGTLLVSVPGQVNLYLSHDAQGDDCKALIHDTLRFDMTSFSDVSPLVVRVHAPGTTELYPEQPLWTLASGLKTKRCSYKLRSVTLPTTMMHIGMFDGPFESGVTDYRVLLIFDTTAAEPSDAVKAAALAGELERLADFGVVTLDETKIARIRSALAAQPGQYWTAEDTVLYFNSWFESGSVNGVRGVYGAKGCGTGVDYELPPNALTAVGIPNAAAAFADEVAGMRAVVNNNGICFNFGMPTENGVELVLSDMAGRRVAALPVVKGRSSIVWPLTGRNGARISSGCYFAAVRNGDRILYTGRVMVP